MDDLKELIDHPSCCWGYIDELRIALAATCKERDELKTKLAAMRNDLCLECGNYRGAHIGACDGCRWKERKQ